jgi:uncharacterized protein with FMN-binding domain
MRRPVIVIVATVAGLVGLLSFRTTPAHLSLGGLSGAAATRTPPSTAAGSAPPTSTTTTGPPPTSGSSTTIPAAAPTTTAPPTSRTATGQAVNYNFGVLTVSVTATGKTITKVGIGSLDDGGNPRSQSIDQQSIPLLEQQAMQAQSANIQGVSGASYTSAGFQQSLQSALGKLGLK